MKHKAFRRGGIKKGLYYFLMFLLIMPFNLLVALPTQACWYPSEGDIIINELMWSGSSLSSYDEWIELKNVSGKADLHLAGCQITKKTCESAEEVMLTIPSEERIWDYYVISNYANDVSSIDVSEIYHSVDLLEGQSAVSLANDCLEIKLYCPDGSGHDLILMDTANDNGAPFEGDNSSPKKSMSRLDVPGDGTLPGSWCTSCSQVNWDSGAEELGTPGADNECGCEPACGNGFLEGEEECDDGNEVSGDGCTETCEIEGACPLVAEGDDIFIDYNIILVSSDMGLPNYEVFDVNIPKGVYNIQFFAFDGYTNRHLTLQNDESYKLILEDDNSYNVETIASEDLLDGVDYTETIQNENDFILAEDIIKMTAMHAVYPDNSSANSVQGGCALFSRVISCGNGFLDSGEECDDGNTIPGDGCSANCTIEVPVCGNDIIEDGEECDGDNPIPCFTGDGYYGFHDCIDCHWGECETDEYCGDGVINGAETCDDGINNGEYGYCNEFCTEDGPFCGDLILNGDEECDGDAPMACMDLFGYNGFQTCEGCVWSECVPSEFCGDGIINDSEICDDGINNGQYGYCNECCTALGPFCGDNILNGDEECDDGNNIPGDGCDENCTIEECDDTVRIKFNFYNEGVANTGTGDMEAKVYTGDGTEYNDGEWITLYQNGVYLTDSSFNPDVTGYAIEREEGRVKIVLYGHHAPCSGWEKGYATVSFDNATVSGFENDLSGGGVEGQGDDIWADNAGQDEVVYNLDEISFDSYLTVTTHRDGYWIDYEIIEDCDDLDCTDNDEDGYAIEGGDCGEIDCDDTDPKINPGMDEICGNSIDDDCDGLIDENCDCELMMARIVVDDYFSEGNATSTNQIHVGSLENIYESGEWFPIYENGAFIEDIDVLNYEHVPGLAVQRLNGSLRVVLHGANPTAQDIEHIRGHIEFYNASPDHLRNDSANNNTLEKDAVVGGYNDEDGTKSSAGDDEVWLQTTDNYSHFWLTVNVADDGYYTDYSSVSLEECLGSICGAKFEDLNHDGIWDEGEDNLIDWTINLNILSGPIDTRITTEDGYCFYGLTAGDYEVEEILQENWTNTTGNPVLVTIDGDNKTVNFGNYFTEPGTCTDNDEDGYAIEGGDCGEIDCNDEDYDINPGVSEVCDGIDNNCDGSIDEGWNIGEACSTGIGACEGQGYLICDASDPAGPAICDAVPGEPSAEVCGDGIDNDCDGETDEGCGGGGGGGGGGGSSLYLHSPAVQPGCDNATITWHTNRNATSRVVCGLSPVSPLGSWPDLGYEFSTEQDLNNITFHSVALPGLAQNTNYYCRAISTYGTKVFSNEISFTTNDCTPYCGDGNVDTDEECDDGNNLSGDGCDAECKSESCAGADYIFETTLKVIGQNCQKAGWTVYQNQDQEVVSILETGLYNVYAEVHRSGPEESQPAENFFFTINRKVGDAILDRPGDETLRTQLAGDFIFFEGENTIIMDTATECPPETLPNSVDIQKVCLYKIDTETLCGDGVLEGAEECDDKNLLNGDGCSSTCKVEIEEESQGGGVISQEEETGSQEEEDEEEEEGATSSQGTEGQTSSSGTESQEGTPQEIPADKEEGGVIGSGAQAGDGEVLGETTEKEEAGDKEEGKEDAEDVCYTDECSTTTASNMGCLKDWWWVIVLLILAASYFAYENYRIKEKKEDSSDSDQGNISFDQ